MHNRDEAVAADINATHINKRYLPDFKLEDGLRAVSNIEEAVRDRDIILVAIPSHSFRDVLKQIKPFITSQQIVANQVVYEANSLNMQLKANSAEALQTLTQQLNQQGFQVELGNIQPTMGGAIGMVKIQ